MPNLYVRNGETIVWFDMPDNVCKKADAMIALGLSFEMLTYQDDITGTDVEFWIRDHKGGIEKLRGPYGERRKLLSDLILNFVLSDRIKRS